MRLRDASGLPRVVVTGMGAVSCVGTGTSALLDALCARRHGLRRMEAFAALGMRGKIGGPVDEAALPPEPPRKLRRFLPAPALYAWHAANEALAQAGLPAARLAGADCGLVLGGGAALSEHEQALADHRARGIAKLSPFLVPRGMSSALSAGLAQAYGVGGSSYTVSSACTSSAHAIGHAMELIQLGRQNVVVAGGAEELHPSTAMWFDAMGALSPQAEPAEASRPFHRARDGFALAAGAGVLVLESLEHAQARGARVLAELAGYGSATDAASMVGPGADGIARALRQALDRAGTLPDYINAHAGGTQGDLAEWQAIASVFAERDAAVPPISSIKGLLGHAPGAAGALDAIACLLMLEHGFLAAGASLDDPDPAFAGAPLLAANREQRIDAALSSSFGFGGSCAALLFRRPVEDAA
ncbi:3-ketoacyl-ACP-synthase [Dorcoceras hygrometricum]|uniref:3-oxoacyl-[acyl-carrier-protein] synthase 1 n=1 Tax=Dorcoceras hygrometricum TaxID=472368 RepID=A0A2Z7A7X2_9LAMI|nr:3-ketoacyl-ACP-synthase [Dorcoceras hygrometricum]